MRDGALVVAHPVRQHLLDFAFDEEQPTTGRPDFLDRRQVDRRDDRPLYDERSWRPRQLPLAFARTQARLEELHSGVGYVAPARGLRIGLPSDPCKGSSERCRPSLDTAEERVFPSAGRESSRALSFVDLLLERLRVGARPLLKPARWVAGDLLHGV